MENTALLTAWAVASITGGFFLLWFIWLQNYYKNLYRKEVKKYCEMKVEKTKADKENERIRNGKNFAAETAEARASEAEKESERRASEVVELTQMLDSIQDEVKNYMVKGTRNILGAVKGVLLKVKQQKELIGTLEIEEKHLRVIKEGLADTYKIEVDCEPEKILDQMNEIVSDHIREKSELSRNNTELEAKQRIAEGDRKSYMIFVRDLRVVLGAKEDELPSEIVNIVDKLKKNQNKKTEEVDLYYKTEIIEQGKALAIDLFGKSYEHALRAYTSKQRRKAFENFFERMSPFFKGKINSIDLKNFNIKNAKNGK